MSVKSEYVDMKLCTSVIRKLSKLDPSHSLVSKVLAAKPDKPEFVP